MSKSSIKDFLGVVIVKASSLLVYCIPLRTALWLGRCGGDIVYLLNSKRRAIAYSNLKSAFPEKNSRELKRINRAHFENLGMCVIEILKTFLMGRKYLVRYVSIKGSGRIEEALSRQKGVILLTAHFGNWEIGSLALSSMGYSMSVFAREQKYTRLNNLLNKYREMTGCKVVTKGFSVREIVKTLKNMGIVGMLADQDAGPNGEFVNFLNRPASMAQGPVVFSLKTGAVILPVFVRRAGYGRHIIDVREVIEVKGTVDREEAIKVNLQKIARVLEEYIKDFPEQWLWSHKRWKSTSKRTVLVLSDGKAGHLNQAVSVAEMVKEPLGFMLRQRGIEEEPIVSIDIVNVKFKNRLARLFMDLAGFFAGSRCQGCLRCLRFCLRKESFQRIRAQYADIIISCGSSLVTTNIFLKYENNAKAVVIMKPGLGRAKRFDLVILPRHDANAHPLDANWVITEAAPNRIRETSRGTNNGIGLLVGGDTKNFKLAEKDVKRVVDGILKIAREMSIDIFVTTSRRTSPEIDAFLKVKLERDERCKLLVIANEKNINGIVPKIFGLSEVVVVSPDSISMISEAVSSGRYVVVFRNHPSNQSKYERAIANLEKQGYLKTAKPCEVYDVVKELLTKKPAVKKIEDRERIIERLKGLM